MDIELQRRVSQASTTRSSDHPNYSSPLLYPVSTEHVRTLKDESWAIMRDKYPGLLDVDPIDILKVMGLTHVCFTRNMQNQLTEICISIAFPLVILQCRSLTNLLASLTLLEDHGGLALPYFDLDYRSVLCRLAQCFDWRLDYAWGFIFKNWRSKAKDADWIDTKTSDLRSNLAEISLMVDSVKEALKEIDKIAGTSLCEITRNAETTFHMFETEILDCTAKAQELRAEQEAKKYLSPMAHTSRRQSWTSGSSPPPTGGIVQRTSFGKSRVDGDQNTEETTRGASKRRWRRSHKKAKVSPKRAENHWTRLFNLAKSPVIVILIAAMPLAIVSTMLYDMPDSIPALDSNFYSTLSQCVSSFAGLYVIVKPILRRGEGGEIETRFPKVFYTMLATSLLTSVASAVGYAWSPPASIPLAYVSGLTLNIATLLVIQDSGNQIKEGFEETGRLAAEVDDLEAELGALRGRY